MSDVIGNIGEMPGQVTNLLGEIRAGNKDAAERLLPIVYAEMKRIASRHMRRESPGHSIQPTVLVHDAYLRLFAAGLLELNDRAHFFAVASRAMRRILIDRARRKKPVVLASVSLSGLAVAAGYDADRLLVVDEAMQRLSVWAPRQCEVVNLRFYGGLSEQEIAQALGVTVRTVRRDWQAARAWLHAELTLAAQRTAGASPIP